MGRNLAVLQNLGKMREPVTEVENPDGGVSEGRWGQTICDRSPQDLEKSSVPLDAPPTCWQGIFTQPSP
jgi:hypothetical protein